MVFEANEVSIYEDENRVLSISFLQNHDHDNYVIIQYVDELDEQDIELGFTKYYITIKERGAYDCLEKVIVEQNSVTFMLNNRGKEIFKEESIQIYNQSLIHSKWDALKNIMSKIFNK